MVFRRFMAWWYPTSHASEAQHAEVKSSERPGHSLPPTKIVTTGETDSVLEHSSAMFWPILIPGPLPCYCSAGLHGDWFQESFLDFACLGGERLVPKAWNGACPSVACLGHPQVQLDRLISPCKCSVSCAARALSVVQFQNPAWSPPCHLGNIGVAVPTQ